MLWAMRMAKARPVATVANVSLIMYPYFVVYFWCISEIKK